jgi:hypothetical protein
MKTILTVFFFIIGGIVYAQSKRHLISITASNNGQINDVLNDFYLGGTYGPEADTYGYKRKAYKLNFVYEFLTKSNYSFYSSLGFGMIKNTYNISNMNGANAINSQGLYNLCIGSKYNFSFDKFEVSTGIELPFYYIGNYNESVKWDNEEQSQILTYNITIDDGFSIGLNSITSIKFYPMKNFFITSSLTFGLMHFDLGDNLYYKDNIVNTDDPSLNSEYEYRIEKSFSSTMITKPELHFGIGININ